jgi:hypothetical protein
MKFLSAGVYRLLTRWLSFYWLCFIFPFPMDLVGLPLQVVPTEHQPQWLKTAGTWYSEGYQWVTQTRNEACQYAGTHYLDVEVIVQMTGSGDTLRTYVGCLFAAVLAAACTLLWSLVLVFIPRIKSVADAWLFSVVRVLIRFFLMQMLLGYGFAKVYPMQFPAPTYRLTQTFGDFSPMGLLWAFMGYSTAYQIFTGTVEVAAGLLLTTRRTTFLGALLTIVAMTQIFALNMCFDVPVKLYSLHYLVMGLFLAAPDLPRLCQALVLHRAVEAVPVAPFLGRIGLDRCALVLRTLMVGALLWVNIYYGYQRWYETHGGPPAPVSGHWEAQSVQLEGKPAGDNDPLNWKSLDFSFKGGVRIQGPKPPMLGYKIKWDQENQQLTLSKYSNPLWTANFHYQLPQPDLLELHGTVEGKAFQARFKQAPAKNYELMTRGFHWIQEMPYNR